MTEDKKFYLQGKDLQREVLTGKDLIRFEWNMLYSCNFRCKYCFFDGKWEEYGKRTVYRTPGEWYDIWERIHELYGRVSLVITGGEPFTYPDFIDVISAVSRLHYPVNISTNGSGNMREFTQKLDPDRVTLTLALHPEFNSLTDIIEKLKYLKKEGFSSDYINFCAYPPYIGKLEEYLDIANAAGEKLKVIPFCGEYMGARYPDWYSEDQKNMLGIDEKWEENTSKTGQMCAAGFRSALVFPDGKVARCGQIGERYLIGNIFDSNFMLLDKPMPCDTVRCPCLESFQTGEEES